MAPADIGVDRMVPKYLEGRLARDSGRLASLDRVALGEAAGAGVAVACGPDAACAATLTAPPSPRATAITATMNALGP